MQDPKHDEIRGAVRERYASIAVSERGCGCKTREDSCCGGGNLADATPMTLGYSEEDAASAPDGAEMGLGCGNPFAIASIQPGQTILDLGSGGGFDVFLAARRTGSTGRAIGVDMTPEMIAKARGNAVKGGYPNVEFRLGEIEYLPIADGSVDLILSNCVINLSPDKPQVFRECYRVLKAGGRLAIADIVATGEMPPDVKADVDAYTGCLSGAAQVDELRQMLVDAGFSDVEVNPREETRELINGWTETGRAGEFAVSAFIEARK